MPKPVYFIVCRDVGQHPGSGLAVISEVVEQVRVKSDSPKLQLSLVSSWMREPGEGDGDPFEWQHSVRAPSGVEFPLPLHVFEFARGDVMKRLSMMLGDLPPLTEAGIYWFACRVRRQGALEWRILPFSLDPTKTCVARHAAVKTGCCSCANATA